LQLLNITDTAVTFATSPACHTSVDANPSAYVTPPSSSVTCTPATIASVAAVRTVVSKRTYYNAHDIHRFGFLQVALWRYR